MNLLKKTGQILLCPLPLLLAFLIQFMSVFFLMMLLTFLVPDPYSFFTEHYIAFLLITQIMTLLVFFLWYFLAYGRKEPVHGPGFVMGLKDAGFLFLLGLGSYLLSAFFLQMASIAAPDLMASYEALIEESGIADLSLLSALSTLLLAPLSEELIFRGVTLRLSKKAFRLFWAANAVQALLFGIYHMNWIQGIYAFLLGLLLGYICETYHSLYASMLLHLFFNFCGTYVAALLNLLFTSAWMNLVLTVLSLLMGLALTLCSLGRIRKMKQGFPS